MTVFRFIIQSLKFYWRQHFAVFLGTVISTAVLTGALIVGDSVKLSLQKLVDVRLGGTRYALQTGDRFVRAQLASEISSKVNAHASALLMVQGIAINPDADARVNRIQIVGIDSSFWSTSNAASVSLSDGEAIISENISQRLALKVGDEFLLRIEKASVIPLNAPFSQDIDPSVAVRLKVKTITDDSGMGRFSLKSNQSAPFNVFVSREMLAEKLDLKGKANVLLVNDFSTSVSFPRTRESSPADILNQLLKENWKIEDLSLNIRELSKLNRFEVLSERIFIDEPIAKSIVAVNQAQEYVLTYLVNSISCKGKDTPYSFVTAATEPIVPSDLKDIEIILNEWAKADLSANIGDSVTLKYFVIGPLRTIKEVKRSFVVRGFTATQSKDINSSLMPLFPGLAAAGSCHDWETGVPIDLDKIRDKDEKYWNEYKGTPKALISMEAGLALWGNRFGSYTSIRFDKGSISLPQLQTEILKGINPNDIGLTFLPVYEQGLNAANNSVDFGGLFLSLSFFVIAAGILLTMLIYSLNTESRKEEIGLLSGLGFERKQIVRIRFGESMLIAIDGSIVGALLGILYNYALVWGLNSVWQGAVHTNSLQVFVLPATVALGASIGLIIALVSIYIVTRRKLQQPISGLIKKGFESATLVVRKYIGIDKLIAIASFAVAAIMVILSLLSGDVNAEMFLSAGGVFLIGCIALVNWILNMARHKLHTKPLTNAQLALKNIARNKNRTLTTVALLALGTFSIIITGANRKTYYGVESSRQSGTGGFAFWCESSLPIQYSLNSPLGKAKYGLDSDTTLAGVEVAQLHSLDGDDASCLNLNQVQRPKILGVNPDIFSSRGSFSAVSHLDGVEPKDAWLALKRNFGDDVIPAIADQTVITWGLKKAVGDTLIYLDESGRRIKLLLVAGLDNSIFQGNILIADSLFVRHFPSTSGSRVMLIDAPVAKQHAVASLLAATFTDYGIEITSTSTRLAEFNSVENTYLTVFMVLGGLGVIIGTFGLGVVLLRNILERRAEIALLMAIGYQRQQVFRLIFTENLIILILGLAAGVLSAIIGILPSVLSPAFTMPLGFITLIVSAIALSGLAWIYFPTRNALKGNIIRGLREE